MPMNLVIREKRKEIGLTQEQIAEYLGVTAPAVNKWEKGATYPDISLLPPLARLLKVDLNTLLCFREEISDQEINQFMKEIADTIHNSGFESGFTLGMEKVREYPNCGKLIHYIAMTLSGTLFMSGTSGEIKKKHEEEITGLYEQAAKSDDDRVRDSSIYMLASQYMNRTEFDKAQEMIDLLPEKNTADKKKLQAYLYIRQKKLAEAAQILERKLLTGVNELQLLLYNLIEVAIGEDNVKEAAHLAEISQKITKLFELWDFNTFVAPLEVAIAKKDVQDSISLLKSAFEAVLIPWDSYSSSLFHHMYHPVDKNMDKKIKQMNIGSKMLSALLSDLETNPKYAFLHENEEFQQLIKQYRAKCKC